MNRKQALNEACFLLRKRAKEENLARFLLMYLLDENSSEFSENINKKLDEKIEKEYFSLINQHIEKDTPLSHLVGFDYFYDRKFIVTGDVLSPRMETEELVYKVIDFSKNKENLKILDLCTGSGIIAITLKKELEDVEIVASDISDGALKVAEHNAKNLGANVNLIKSDIFENINEKFNIIVSNPPYIAYKDKESMENNVLNYDPHLALFADEDGMYFYRKIIEQADNYLEENGIIFFEIGHDQKEKIEKLGQENNYKTIVYKDINGKDRMATLQKVVD